MHAHTLQEQNLLAAPLIVRTPDDLKRDEQEVVVLLREFSFKSPEELLAKLKGRAASGGMAMDHGAMSGITGMQHMMSGKGMAGMTMPGMAAMDVTTSTMTPISPTTARSTIPKSWRSTNAAAAGCAS
jgi:hypothetical protein